MSRIISIHSFRRGTGKSHLTANVAAALALAGRRVGLVDADFQSPGLHILFGLDEERIAGTLNDYLRSRCAIEQAVFDVTPSLADAARGKILLVPSSTRPAEINYLMHASYNTDRFHDGLYALVEKLKLDALIVDTHAGLNEETLASFAACDTAAIILRLDQQDYQGTAIMVDVVRQLQAPRLTLVVNQAPLNFDPLEVKTQVEQTYQCEVAAVLPYLDEMVAMAGADIFVLRYPEHPITGSLKRLAASLVA